MEKKKDGVMLVVLGYKKYQIFIGSTDRIFL